MRLPSRGFEDGDRRVVGLQIAGGGYLAAELVADPGQQDLHRERPYSCRARDLSDAAYGTSSRDELSNLMTCDLGLPNPSDQHESVVRRHNRA